MNAGGPTNAREVLAELTALKTALASAAEQTSEGKQIDLSQMGNRIGVVCDAAVTLSREEGRALLPAMEQLIASLDDLTTQLNATFGHLPKLHSEAAPDAAASAYGRSDKQDR